MLRDEATLRCVKEESSQGPKTTVNEASHFHRLHFRHWTVSEQLAASYRGGGNSLWNAMVQTTVQKRADGEGTTQVSEGKTTVNEIKAKKAVETKKQEKHKKRYHNDENELAARQAKSSTARQSHATAVVFQ